MALKRITLDLDKEQHTFLKLFTSENNALASVVFRVMVDRLEKDAELQEWVLDAIFSESD